MPLVTDLDDLNQGTETLAATLTDLVVTVPGTGADALITSAGSNMPALAADEYFEIRGAADAENNGLFQVVTVNTSTSSYEVDKVTATTPVTAGSAAARMFGATGTASEKSIHYDVNARDIYVIEQGNVDAAGVLLQALYSLKKVLWKSDADLIKHPFPMIAITPEQFEFIDDWNPTDTTGFTPAIRSRKMLRTGGWSEVSEVGTNLLRQYAGVISLGGFEDVLDTAYFFQGTDATDTGAATDFTFANAVNEAVQVFDEVGDLSGDTPAYGTTSTITRVTGSFITDGFVVGGQVTIRGSTSNNGTFVLTGVAALTLTVTGTPLTVEAWGTSVIAWDNRNAFDIKLRIRDGDTNGKTFDSSDLTAIGISGAAGMDNKVFRFPLANQTDLKILETDANIDANTPYTQMAIRYFDQAFNREVDSATNRDFGIVIDVGTHSGVDGSFSAGLSVLTSAEGGIPTDATYTGGTIRIHEGTDENTVFNISGTPTATTVTITSTFTATESNISFTIQRATPVVATIQEIYEFTQRQLRRDVDIDATDQIVVGRTADELLTFVGDALRCGQDLPDNPNGGGSGVVIEGFDTNDTNSLSFFDNTGTSRTFPFVAAGTINFNANLVNDTGPAEYFMFFEYTERFTNTGFGISGVTADAGTLDSSTTNLVTELADGDFIRLSGFVATEDNGIFVLTGTPAGAGPWTAAVRKLDGVTLIVEAAGASVSLDKNPIDSDDAIIVNDNTSTPITGNVGGSSVAFDFDYDNNVQGGRTFGTDAAIIIRALGEDVAAFVETSGTITRATGLTFSVTAPLERNFTNPV
jgi:hypothetical protein